MEEIYNKEFYKGYNGQHFGEIVAPIHIELTKKFIHGDVLDAGAGSGALMKELRKLPNVKTVSGIDICPEADDIREGNLEDMPYLDSSFDCVMCTGTMEHLNWASVSKATNEIWRILKRDGIFIMTVPYGDDLAQNQVICPYCHNKFDRWGHQISFNGSTILASLKKFEILRLFTAPVGFMTSHPNLSPFISIIRMFGFFKGDDLYFVIARKYE